MMPLFTTLFKDEHERTNTYFVQRKNRLMHYPYLRKNVNEFVHDNIKCAWWNDDLPYKSEYAQDTA